MAAVVWRAGRMISSSCNGTRFGQHAEIRALSKDIDARGSTVAVARSNGGISTPCSVCLQLIIAMGVRRVIYHDGYEPVIATPTTIISKEFSFWPLEKINHGYSNVDNNPAGEINAR